MTNDHVSSRTLIARHWRGGRVVECTGLENQRSFIGPVGSNPTLSAILKAFRQSANLPTYSVISFHVNRIKYRYG